MGQPHPARRTLLVAMGACLVLVAAGITWALWPHHGALSVDAAPSLNPPQSSDAPAPTYEAPQSLPADAGQIRSPESCTPGHLGELGPSDIVLAINGQPLQEAGRAGSGQEATAIIQASAQLPRWLGLARAEQGRTANSERRLHLIGMGEGSIGLGNLQSLGKPAHPAVSASGKVTPEGFAPFGPVTFLDQQLPGDAQAAPIAGSVNQGRAVWIEQLVTDSPQRANEYPWRVMSAPFLPDAPVTEVLSSWALSQSPTSPAPTSWRPPVTTGTHVAAEYWELNTATGQWEARVGIVSLDKPGHVQNSYQGRLPIAVGQDIAWVEDTTSFGIDAQNDVFTIRWLNDAHPPISLHTSAFAKVQWLEGTPDYLVIVLQDTCAGMTWIGRYDRATELFSAWVASEQDRIAASLNGNILVWGNGSGNRSSQMYRWDLATKDVTFLGDAEGYSVPFSSGATSTAVPSFTTDSGAPLVSWGWYTTDQ